MAPLVRAGSAFGNALAGNRPLGREDRTVLGTVSVVILLAAVLAGFFPTLVGWVFAAVAFWFGTVTGLRALAQARRGRAEEGEAERQTTQDQEGQARP